MPPRMPRLFGAERLGGILDQRQAVALAKSGDRVHDRVAVRPHAAPDQNVPITVSRNSAIPAGAAASGPGDNNKRPA